MWTFFFLFKKKKIIDSKKIFKKILSGFSFGRSVDDGIIGLDRWRPTGSDWCGQQKKNPTVTVNLYRQKKKGISR